MRADIKKKEGNDLEEYDEETDSGADEEHEMYVKKINEALPLNS